MKMKKILVIVTSLGLLTCLSVLAEVNVPNPPVNSNPILIPNPPKINAKGYILLDANSGYVITQKNADVRMPPASLTKIMTLYVAAEALKSGRAHLEDNVRVSENAWRARGSRMFIKVGTDVPLNSLIQGIAVASGNDAAIAVAEDLAGSESSFADLMNKTALKIGMKNTNFTDSNGLPSPNHYTTPSDMATLATAWIQNYPEYYKWFSEKWFAYNNIKQPNRNRLLWRDPSVDGFKTGHTDDAGYCLISSAERNGMRLISVVMGAPSDKIRTNDSQSLLNYGFRFFETHNVYSTSPVSNIRTYYGINKTTPIGGAHGLYVTVPIGQYKNVKIQLNHPAALKAPIQKGQQCGTATIILNNNKIAEEPIYALQDNPRGSFFKRMIDHIEKIF